MNGLISGEKKNADISHLLIYHHYFFFNEKKKKSFVALENTENFNNVVFKLISSIFGS